MTPQGGRPRRAKITNSLWKYRKRAGFTQRQVAALLGSSDGHVAEYEKGDLLPSLTTAFKLGAIYGVPVEFLFWDLYDQLRAEVRAKEARMPVRRRRETPPFQAPESLREFRWPGLALP